MRKMRHKARGIRQLTTIKNVGLHFRFWVMNMLVLLCAFSATAQRVSATVDREKILLGEAVTLTLKAENINTTATPVGLWFSIPDSINHLEITSRSAIDTVDINGFTSYLQTITLTSFDSGRWTIPALQLKLQISPTETLALNTDSLHIDVLPVDVSALADYRPIKDIIEVEVKPDYTKIIAIIIGVILLAALVYFIIKQNKKVKPIVLPAKPKINLFEDTISQLDALQKQDLPNLQLYTRLDEICRNYIQQQLHVRAMHLTQDEMMVQLNVFIPDKEVRTQFYQLLRLIGAVKFAKYQPPQTQQQQSIGIAKTTVQQIHYHIQRPAIANVK